MNPNMMYAFVDLMHALIACSVLDDVIDSIDRWFEFSEDLEC